MKNTERILYFSSFLSQRNFRSTKVEKQLTMSKQYGSTQNKARIPVVEQNLSVDR